MTIPAALDERSATISGYRFDRTHLRVSDRQPGISAFMRIRNGADFLESTIRSHIDFFDEIVAVYNQCDDQTPQILMRLQEEFGRQRLRVMQYADRVFPPGSDGHIRTRPDSPNSLVNYYNFSLAATRYQFATKLDDDHLAISAATQSVTDAIRSGRLDADAMQCFSGLNVFRGSDGRLAVLASDPVSGGGDIGFFRVTSETYFTHDRRFERFQRGGLRRQFAGFLYWHLKYLKPEMGFANYDLAENPNSRYARRKAKLDGCLPHAVELHELARRLRPSLLDRLSMPFSEKKAITSARDAAIESAFPDASVAAAMRRTVSPTMQSHGVISSLIPAKCA